MNLGRPSFHRLFGRGRYRFIKPTDNEKDAHAIIQRERFASAAIAFCLKHDPIFRNHFWEKICSVHPDSEIAPQLAADTVWLEPPAWADLSFRYTDAKGQLTWIVIEVKAGAPLEHKQNPCKSEFLEPGIGYGWLFSEASKKIGARMRYVVLGSENEIAAKASAVKNGIETQWRSWYDLLGERPRTLLSDDLVSSLAELNIGAFAMEKAKKFTITSGLEGVGDAWKVLQAVCVWLQVNAAQQQFDAYSPNNDGTESGGANTEEFGIYLKQPRKNSKLSEVYRQFLKLAGKKSPVIWFGYLADEGVVRKSVFFYCKEEKSRDLLASKLKSDFSKPLVGGDKDDLYVHLETPSEKQAGSDVEWFVDVLTKVSETIKAKIK